MAPAGEFRNPPLVSQERQDRVVETAHTIQLVLNGFQQQPDGPALPQLRLMSTMFQGIFPPISVEKVRPHSDLVSHGWSSLIR